jgi:hypothetical protein
MRERQAAICNTPDRIRDGTLSNYFRERSE